MSPIEPAPSTTTPPLTNTLVRTHDPVVELARYAAPPNRIDEIAEHLHLARVERFERAMDETDCPECAERIKVRAKVCRFCGADLTERGASDRRRDRRKRTRSESSLVATRRGSTGDCFCGGRRVEKSPWWAVVFAICLFPLGLLFLIVVKEYRCTRCGNTV